MESISELRKICQTNAIHCRYRFISIYFTKLFLRTPVTPNQITLLSLVIGLSGALLLCLNDFFYSILGVVFLHSFFILDCIDGEVARYKKKVSLGGKYFERMCHQIINPTLFICLGFRFLNELNHAYLLPITILATFCVFLNNIAVLYGQVLSSSRDTEDDVCQSMKDFCPNSFIGNWVMRLTIFFYSIYTVVDLILLGIFLQFFFSVLNLSSNISGVFNPLFVILVFYAFFYTISLCARMLITYRKMNT